MKIDPLTKGINAVWDDSIVDRLTAYIRIPNKSPMFDPDWEHNGHMEAAINLMAEWCRAQPVAGMRVDVRRLPGKTPLLFIDIHGELPGNVLLYGHLTNIRNSPAGCPDSARGNRCCARASCMAGVARTTAMRCSLRSLRLRHSKPKRCLSRDACCSSKRVRKVAALICRRTSMHWEIRLAIRHW